MKTRSNEQDMKCPKCGRFSLRNSEMGIRCQTCGYELSPGEATKFRLFQMLKAEGKTAKV